MKTSVKGKIALAASEGIVLSPYLDSVGVWTALIGHTKAAGDPDPTTLRGKTLTVDYAMEVFERDLAKFEKIVLNEVKVPLTQQEFDALVHFVFNTGTLRTKNKQPSNLLRLLNEGKKQEAFSKGFHGWLKPKELLGRRNKERDIALYGKYGTTIVPVYSVGSSNKPVLNRKIDLGYMLRPIATKPTTKPAVPPKSDNFLMWLLKKLGVIS